MSIGSKIKALREERGWTQAKLAERADLNPAHLSQIETGHIDKPNISTITAVFEAMNVSPGKVYKHALEELDRDEFMQLI